MVMIAASGKRLDEGWHISDLSLGISWETGQLRSLHMFWKPDRSFIKTGQAVSVRFDAIPGTTVKGMIESISRAPEARAAWGKGVTSKRISN